MEYYDTEHWVSLKRHARTNRHHFESDEGVIPETSVCLYSLSTLRTIFIFLRANSPNSKYLRTEPNSVTVPPSARLKWKKKIFLNN